MNKLQHSGGGAQSKLKSLSDMIIASILWVLLSIPVVTMVPATVALMGSIQQGICRQEGHVAYIFWKTFKETFRQAFLAGLILLALMAWFVYDYYVMSVAIDTVMGSSAAYIMIFCIVMLLALLLWFISLTNYIARNGGTLKQVMKHSLRILFKNLFRFVLSGLILLVHVGIGVSLPWLLFLLPATFAWSIQGFIGKVFDHYVYDDFKGEKVS